MTQLPLFGHRMLYYFCLDPHRLADVYTCAGCDELIGRNPAPGTLIPCYLAVPGLVTYEVARRVGQGDLPDFCALYHCGCQPDLPQADRWLTWIIKSPRLAQKVLGRWARR